MLNVECFHFLFNTVAVSSSRGDEFCAEFFADVRDVNIQQVRERAVILVKEMFVKLRACDDFAAMQREKFHQRIFARGEFNRFARPQNANRFYPANNGSAKRDRVRV